MKPAACLAAIASMILLWSAASIAAEPKKKPSTTRVVPSAPPASPPTKLVTTKMMLIDRRKASLQQLQNALPLYEEKLTKLSTDYEAGKKLHDEGLISRTELENRERALTNARLELQRVREWIAEDDVSLSLAENAAREKTAQVSKMSPGEYEESATLIRYNGTSNWSLAGAEKIAKFFQARFGQPLPISALGQSATHDSMGLDHRDALDIALQPESKAGRALISFLRTNGVPFMAFRSRVLGMSTGAHIHVGRPSPRLLEVKHRSTTPSVADKSAVHG
jgi:hypothetical protein